MAQKDLIKDYWTSPIGGNWAYMIKNQKAIREFIRVNELKPATIGQIPSGKALPTMRSSAATATRMIPIDLGIRGGIRSAHLHLGDKIYLLKPDQWKKFSGGIVADFKERLKEVKEVTFEEAMLVGNLSQTLSRT